MASIFLTLPRGYKAGGEANNIEDGVTVDVF